MEIIIRKVICECGDDTYRKDFDGDKPIWICHNCKAQTKRRVMPSKAVREINRQIKEMDRKDSIRAEVYGILAGN